jgi:cyanamide hydratase
MSSTTNDPIAEHGWTAVPLDPEAIFQGKPYLNEPGPILVKDIHFPSDDPIVVKAQQYAKEHLPAQTFNHSMRVFYWGNLPFSAPTPLQPT